MQRHDNETRLKIKRNQPRLSAQAFTSKDYLYKNVTGAYREKRTSSFLFIFQRTSYADSITYYERRKREEFFP